MTTLHPQRAGRLFEHPDVSQTTPRSRSVKSSNCMTEGVLSTAARMVNLAWPNAVIANAVFDAFLNAAATALSASGGRRGGRRSSLEVLADPDQRCADRRAEQ